MDKPYVVNMPGGIILTVEMNDRPVDLEIFVPTVGNIVFHRDKGDWPAVKGTVTTTGIPAANYRKYVRSDGKVDKHEVLTKSGDSILYSDPEM